MSYCRWSCMGGQCDVYAYADVAGGVSIHVGTRRRVLNDTVPPDPTPDLISGKMTAEAWSEKWKLRNEALDRCALEAIGLSQDGKSWNLPFVEAAEKIMALRKEGYYIPEGVEEDILEDVDLDEE